MLVGKCPKSGFEMLVVKTLCREKARRFNCNVTTFTRPYDRYRQTDSLSEPLFIKKKSSATAGRQDGHIRVLHLWERVLTAIV